MTIISFVFFFFVCLLLLFFFFFFFFFFEKKASGSLSISNCYYAYPDHDVSRFSELS